MRIQPARSALIVVAVAANLFAIEQSLQHSPASHAQVRVWTGTSLHQEPGKPERPERNKQWIP
jgi:hypothetical protein